MSNESSIPQRLILTRGPMAGRLTVDVYSFVQFNAHMDQQLEALVQRWSDFVTPASRRRDRALARPESR